MKKYIILVLFIACTKISLGQAIPRFNPDTLLTVVIDSVVVIKSAKAGLSAEDFINQIVNDTSFYEAFRNMKKYDFIAENSVYTYNKKDEIEGSMYRKIHHMEDASGAHKMQYLEKKDTGKLFKNNGKYQLYTVEMFNYIFMNAYNSDFMPGCSSSPGKKGGGANESYDEKLKTLVFNPRRPLKGIRISSETT